MSEKGTQLIRLVLVDGDPEGLRTVLMAGRTTSLTGCPVSRLSDLTRREEAQRPAVYFLIGEQEDASKEVIYIGECDSLADRFRSKHHAMEKADWRQIIVASTTDGTFNKAHARRAEHLLVQRARNLQRVEVLTATTSAGVLDEGDAAFALDFVGNVAALAEVLGVSAFRPKASKSASILVDADKSIELSKQEVFRFIGSPGVQARLQVDGETFLILSGSQARATETPSCPSAIRALREKAISTGALILHPTSGLMSFVKDFALRSTSGAGGVVGGMACRGPTSWQHEVTGQTYAEWVEKPVLEDGNS